MQDGAHLCTGSVTGSGGFGCGPIRLCGVSPQPVTSQLLAFVGGQASPDVVFLTAGDRGVEALLLDWAAAADRAAEFGAVAVPVFELGLVRGDGLGAQGVAVPVLVLEEADEWVVGDAHVTAARN